MLESGHKAHSGEDDRVIQLDLKQASQTRLLILVTGVATTFMVWSSLADPVNVPKMFVLAIFSAWILGSVVAGIWAKKVKVFSPGQWVILGFVLCMLLSALLTDVKYTAFYGALQRNDGAISYLALAVLSYAAMMSFSLSSLGQIRNTLFWVGLVLAGYGLLQTRHHDFIRWNLIYNPIIGTLGNPDFISAFIGVCSTATLWMVFATRKRWVQASASALILFELFIVERTGSSQGLFIIGVGFSILIVSELWRWKRNVGVFSITALGVGSIPIVLGIFNFGPLAARIYRSSIRSRIDYWHAAISMFQAHPLAGVGIDRFADSYGQYAPRVQVAPDQYTNNAHNVFLQLLATGGLLVIIPYLLLIGLIFYSAVHGIRVTSGGDQRNLVALFSIWFALLVISSISIDNLGVTIWFWVSGGALYGVTHQNPEEKTKSGPKQKSHKSRTASASDELHIIAPIISLLIALVMLLFMIPAWRSSAMLMDLQRYQGGLSKTQFAEKISQVSAVQPGNLDLQIALADIALRSSEFDLAFQILKSVNRTNLRSSNGNYLAAIGYEMSRKYESAIPYRRRLMVIDQWNTGNMLVLVKDYLQVGDLTSARTVSRKISELRPGGGDAVAAEAAIKG